MKIVIRSDSSYLIGSGHLMRCLTLAERLRKDENADIHFISRDLPGNLAFLVTKNGFKLHLLPPAKKNENLFGYAKWLTVTEEEDADEVKEILKDIGKIDLLVADSYAIDFVWEDIVRPFVNKIMVIDDLANRKHNCDILLDQNFYLDKDKRYIGLVPEYCEMRLGSGYVLFREEFYEAKKILKKRDGKVKNILVFYGGSDATNETMKVLNVIKKFKNFGIFVDIIVGNGNINKNEIENVCSKFDFINFYCQVDNISKFMAKADLSFGAGGSATWERLFLKLPCIVTAIAENQEKICEDCFQAGFIDYVGKAEEVTEEILQNKLEQYLKFGIDYKKWNFDIDWGE